MPLVGRKSDFDSPQLLRKTDLLIAFEAMVVAFDVICHEAKVPKDAMFRVVEDARDLQALQLGVV